MKMKGKAMKIEIIDENQRLNNHSMQIIQDVIELGANYLNVSDEAEVDVTIVDNNEIRELNATYRQIDRATDVLSFSMMEDVIGNLIDFSHLPIVHLGDIVISNDKVIEQAQDYGHSYERELAFLTIHGFLHLNGFDHMNEQEEAEMFGIQEKILEQYGLAR